MSGQTSTKRGRAFEVEIANLLRAFGFEVTENAKAAKPRQTDIFAGADGIDLLVEAKNRKRKIDVGDIDALRSRLNRVAPDIVGVIFTTSKLTREAIKLIESDRQREILVFVQDEIERLRRGEQSLKGLIERKRKELRVGGKVWFGPLLKLEYAAVTLPAETVKFDVRDKAYSYFESESSFSGACFALQIPDPGWSLWGGEGARLILDLEVYTVKDLRNVFGCLHERFGLSRNGAFSIQQSKCCWYGIGPENFLEAVAAWRERYRKSKSREFHNSEGLIYFDQFRDGWVEISSQQNVGSRNHDQSIFFHSQLVIQLPGIPVDTSPFLKLCRYLGAEWANFEFIASRLTITRRLKSPLKLRTVGLMVDKNPFPRDAPTHEGTVVGIVAQNPFYGAKKLPEELSSFDSGAQQEMKEIKVFPCALRDWHSVNIAVDYYRLAGIEATVGGASHIIRPFGTWNRILE